MNMSVVKNMIGYLQKFWSLRIDTQSKPDIDLEVHFSDKRYAHFCMVSSLHSLASSILILIKIHVIIIITTIITIIMIILLKKS